MYQAGFVLAGGKSSRMGADKAMLPFRGTTVLQYVAETVRQSAGSVFVVGDPAKYASLPLEVIADRINGRGPLSGIDAALASGRAEWNLLVACDLPMVPVGWLEQLLEEAQARNMDALLSFTDRPEPLCAVYHSRCLPAIESALRTGNWKVTDVLESLRMELLAVPDKSWLVNANTPEEWRALIEAAP